MKDVEGGCVCEGLYRRSKRARDCANEKYKLDPFVMIFFFIILWPHVCCLQGVPQFTPFEFQPTTNDSVPDPYLGMYYLFNIAQDPTETHNLAEAMPEKLWVAQI